MKELIKDLTHELGVNGVEATKAFAKAIQAMAKGAIAAAGMVIKAWKSVIAVFDIVASGYTKLMRVIGQGALSFAKDKLEGITNTSTTGYSMSQMKLYYKQKEEQIKLVEELTGAIVNYKKEEKEISQILNDTGKSMDEVDKKVRKYIKSIEDYKPKDRIKSEETLIRKTIKGIKDIAEAKAKAADKAAKDGLDAIQEYNERFTDSFANSFDAMIHGDLVDSFQGFFDTIGGTMMSNFISDTSKKLSKGLSDAFGGLSSFGSFLVGGAFSILGTLLGGLFSSGTPITKDDWQKKNNVANDPESNSIVNLLESMDWSLTRNLVYSRGIFDNLAALVEQSDKASVSLSSNFSFSNKDSFSTGGLAGFSSKDIKTLFTGLELQANTINDIIAQTLDVTQTTRTSWWGLSSNTTKDTTRRNVDDATQRAITQAYDSGISAIVSASQALGITTAENVLNSFAGTLHKLDFEGKTQEEISAMISGAIGADLDEIAKSIAPYIGSFQKAGERYTETMMRVTYEMENINHAFDRMGGSFRHLGRVAVVVSQSFIAASGGMDNALTNINGYIENFYTDTEKQALRVKELSTTGLYSTADAYRAEVEAMQELAVTGSIGHTKRLAELLRLQDVYSDYYDELDRLEEERVYKIEKYLELQKDAEKQALADAQDILDEKQRLSDETMRLQVDEAKNVLAFHEDILNRIEKAYSGSLSYLNSIEKADYLDRFAQQQLSTGNTQGYFDALYKQLEYEKKISTSREEYAIKLDTYIAKLKDAEYQEKTIGDVVISLENIREQIVSIEGTIENASYQSPLEGVN